MRKLFVNLTVFLCLFSTVFVASSFLYVNKTEAATCTFEELNKGKINTSTGCQCPEGTSLGNDTTGKTCKPPTQSDKPCTDYEQAKSGCLNGATKSTAQQEYDDNESFWVRNLIRPAFKIFSFTLMKFASYFLGVAGVLLNAVLDYTIVQMAKNFTTGGIGAAINSSWTTVRDIANMSFIFVLLYMSIQLILGLKGTNDARNLIVKIVIAALLINFSMFGTKVIIDASNVVALTFYEAISPGATTASLDGLDLSGTNLFQTGLSNSLMDPLRLSSLTKLNDAGLITTGGIITLGLMGTLMLLIATFVFLTVSILFIVRFVVLVFVLILSPIALVADIVPGIQPYFKQWKEALINQSFFPAVYFFLTWITIKLLRGVMQSFNNPEIGPAIQDSLKTVSNSGSLSLQTNYASGIGGVMVSFSIVITFLIMSLTLAKKMANSATPGIDGLVKWGSGAAGAVTFGMAGRLGRGTIGRLSQNISDDKNLQQKALEGNMSARLTLAASKKIGSSSFDVRGTALGKQLGAGDAQKGGYAKDVKNKEEERKELVKSIKNTDGTNEQMEEDRTEKITQDAKSDLDEAKAIATNNAKTAVPETPTLTAAKTRAEDLRKKAELAPSLVIDGMDGAARKRAYEAAQFEAERLQKMHDESVKAYIERETKDQQEIWENANQVSAEAKKAHTKLKEERGQRVESAAKSKEKEIESLGSSWKNWRRYKPSNKRVMLIGKIKKEDAQAAAVIRKNNKEKSNKDKMVDAAKALAKEEADKEKGEAPATTPTPAAPTPPPTPPSPAP